MRFLRMWPADMGDDSWPFSSLTRNMALGRVSGIEPSIDGVVLDMFCCRTRVGDTSGQRRHEAGLGSKNSVKRRAPKPAAAIVAEAGVEVLAARASRPAPPTTRCTRPATGFHERPAASAGCDLRVDQWPAPPIIGGRGQPAPAWTRRLRGKHALATEHPTDRDPIEPPTSIFAIETSMLCAWPSRCSST